MLSIAAVASADSANASANTVDSKPVGGNEIIGISPFALKDTMNLDMTGNQLDPRGTFFVTVGYPNIKMSVKNSGLYAFRVEVQHKAYKTVIFNKTVSPGQQIDFVNNDSSPLVSAGDYEVTVYGGSGLPKGQVILKSSNTMWP